MGYLNSLLADGKYYAIAKSDRVLSIFIADVRARSCGETSS